MEVLVYIAVFSIIAVSIFALVLWISEINTKAKVMREVLTDARTTMAIITHEIKSAKSVYAPTTNGTQLSLETLNYLPAEETASYVDIYLCGSKICLKKESQSPQIITSGSVSVINFSIAKIVTGAISSFQINLTVSYNNPSSRPEYQAQISLTSTASLRETGGSN